MTPEEIVALIGNIANRPDLRETQERQVREIKALIQRQIDIDAEICELSRRQWESMKQTDTIAARAGEARMNAHCIRRQYNEQIPSRRQSN